MQLGAVISEEEATVEGDDKNQEKGRGKENSSNSSNSPNTLAPWRLQPDDLAGDPDSKWAADALARELERIAIEIELELQEKPEICRELHRP